MHVSVADPGIMLGVGGFENDPTISAVAAEARGLLRKVAESLTRP